MVNSNAKGKRAELAVANYLTREGIPARRHVRTGTSYTHDEGDIRLDTAPVTIEVKDHERVFTPEGIAVLVAKLQRQKRDGDLGILIVKRAGYADPALWRAWLSGRDTALLLLGKGTRGAMLRGGVDLYIPELDDAVGFTFKDVVRLLKSGGWIEQPVNPFLTAKG